MTSLSTHVLDSALGRPAAGITVEVLGPGGAVLAREDTDADGRIRFDVVLAAGTHRLSFATGEWFGAAERATLYPQVDVHVDVDPSQPHYHVALLLGPWSYTTYRGS